MGYICNSEISALKAYDIFFYWYWHISSQYVSPAYIYIWEYVFNPILSRTVFYLAYQQKFVILMYKELGFFSLDVFHSFQYAYIPKQHSVNILSTLSPPKCRPWCFNWNHKTLMDKYVGNWPPNHQRTSFLPLTNPSMSSSLEMGHSHVAHWCIFMTFSGNR